MKKEEEEEEERNGGSIVSRGRVTFYSASFYRTPNCILGSSRKGVNVVFGVWRGPTTYPARR